MANPKYYGVSEAAERLHLTTGALRRALLRAAREDADGAVRAVLTPGVRGFKVGSRWRVWIGRPESPVAEEQNV